MASNWWIDSPPGRHPHATLFFFVATRSICRPYLKIVAEIKPAIVSQSKYLESVLRWGPFACFSNHFELCRQALIIGAGFNQTAGGYKTHQDVGIFTRVVNDV